MRLLNIFKNSNKIEENKKIDELVESLDNAYKTIAILSSELDKQTNLFNFGATKETRSDEVKPRFTKARKTKNFQKTYDEMSQIGYINSKEADKIFNGYSGISTSYASKGLKHIKRGRLYFFKKEDIENFIQKHCKVNMY